MTNSHITDILHLKSFLEIRYLLIVHNFDFKQLNFTSLKGSWVNDRETALLFYTVLLYLLLYWCKYEPILVCVCVFVCI